MKTKDSVSRNTDETSNPSDSRSLSRRQLLQAGGVAATAFTIVPRHVLGGAGFVAPSDKITLACIGFGTQAIREIGGVLASPNVQIVAVCDVEKDGVHYLEWGKNQIRDGIRRLIESPTWREGFNHVPGGVNVLYLDGHVKFARYGGPGLDAEFPVNKAALVFHEVGEGEGS